MLNTIHPCAGVRNFDWVYLFCRTIDSKRRSYRQLSKLGLTACKFVRNCMQPFCQFDNNYSYYAKSCLSSLYFHFWSKVQQSTKCVTKRHAYVGRSSWSINICYNNREWSSQNGPDIKCLKWTTRQISKETKQKSTVNQSGQNPS